MGYSDDSQDDGEGFDSDDEQLMDEDDESLADNADILRIMEVTYPVFEMMGFDVGILPLEDGWYTSKRGLARRYDSQGQLHNDNDEPAFEAVGENSHHHYDVSLGEKRWYRHGSLHREDGPAITNSLNNEQWWVNGRLHRNGGPAVIHPSHYGHGNGLRIWYKYGKKHRIDGPAVEDEKMPGHNEYWLCGDRLYDYNNWRQIVDLIRSKGESDIDCDDLI